MQFDEGEAVHQGLDVLYTQVRSNEGQASPIYCAIAIGQHVVGLDGKGVFHGGLRRGFALVLDAALGIE